MILWIREGKWIMHHAEKNINNYTDKMLIAAQEGRGSDAILYADRAVAIKCPKPEIQWNTAYNHCIMHYVYDIQADKNALYEEMLQLDEKAFELEENAFSTIFEGFLQLQYYLLLFGMENCAKIKKYHKIAYNFYNYLEKNNTHEVGNLNYYEMSLMSLCVYYAKTGRMLSAIKYGELFLGLLEEDCCLSEMEFYALIYLARCYQRGNNIRNSKKVCFFLYKKLLLGETEKTSQNIIQSWLLVYAGTYIKSMLYAKGYELILECLEKGIIFHDNPNDQMYAIYADLLKLSENTNIILPKDVQEKMEIVFAEKCAMVDELDRCVDAEVYYYLYLFCKRKQKENLTEKYMTKAVGCFLYGYVSEEEREKFLLVMSEGIKYYHNTGKAGMEEKTADCIMKNLKSLYSYAELYLDNVEMEGYVSLINTLYRIAYSYYTSSGKMKKAFVYSVNYKNCLLSLVRARNKKIYQDGHYDEKILQKYNDLKDDTANKKNYRYQKDRQDLVVYSEIKELGYRFSDAYEKNRALEWYTYENIMTNIPCNTAAIEIVCSDSSLWQGESDAFNILEYDEKRKNKVDIFVLAKVDSVYLLHKSIECSGELYQQLNLLFEKIGNPKLNIRHEAEYIGQSMFESFFELLEKVERIYISPHMDFYKVPFGLIFDYCNPKISEKEITYCQSLRDLFESDYGVTGSFQNSCIIGGPAYAVNTSEDMEQRVEVWMEKYKENSKTNRDFVVESIKSLPFSEYEANEIAELMGTRSFTLENATKYKVKRGYSYLHIATHGWQQLVGELNSWFDSALTFSGVWNWYMFGQTNKEYGNGLLTAEEISRMDLRETNLVTLSACKSADSRYSIYEQQSGLHLAFGVAGVKYVISSLWEVDDLAGSLLMIFLYEYIKRGDSIPLSLDNAKIKLRTTTVKEIRERFKGEAGRLGGNLEKNVLMIFEGYPEQKCPYNAPKYWASFICYQYKF